MLKIKEAIVVEGRYDKNTLSQLVDGVILETSGFGIFKDEERLALLLPLAGQRGIIVLTDSDGAGFVIRNFLKARSRPGRSSTRISPTSTARNAANAHRGRRASSGGGHASRGAGAGPARAGAPFWRKGRGSAWRQPRPGDHQGRSVRSGVSGAPGATQRRQALLRSLALPEHLSANALLPVLNALYSYEEFASATAGCESSGHAW